MTYLVYADNLLNGRGLVDATGSPVYGRQFYVGMLAGVQALFGKSLLAVAVFEAMWSAGLVTIVYLIGRELFPLRIAVSTAVLFLATPGLIFWLPRHVDPVWPTLGLAALWLALLARERAFGRAVPLLIGSGACLALALNAKEMAFLLVPAMVLLIAGLDPVQRWRKTALFLVALAGGIALTAWLATLLDAAEAPAAASNHLQALERRIGGWTLEGLQRLVALSVEGVVNYLVIEESATFTRMVPASWIGLIGLGLALIRVFRRPRSTPTWRAAMVIVVLCLAVAPFSVYAAFWLMRPSQNLVMVAGLYLAIGLVLWWLCAAAARVEAVGWRRRVLDVGALGLPVLCLVALQLSGDPRQTERVAQSSFFVRALSGDFSFTSVLRGESLGVWMEANPELLAEHGNRLVIPDIRYQHAAAWVAEGDAAIEGLPFRSIGDGIHWPYFESGVPSDPDSAVISLYNWRPPYPMTAIFLLTRQETRAVLRPGTLIAFSGSALDIRVEEWLKTQVALTSVDVIGSGWREVRIYRVDGWRESVADSYSVDPRVGEYLAWVRQAEPWRYEAMRPALLLGDLRLTPAEVDALLQVPTVDDDNLLFRMER